MISLKWYRFTWQERERLWWFYHQRVPDRIALARSLGAMIVQIEDAAYLHFDPARQVVPFVVAISTGDRV